MTPLEQLSTAVGIAGTIIGAVHWLIRRAEKRAAEREANRKEAERINSKLIALESLIGQMREDYEEDMKTMNGKLQEVQKDFAQFVQRLFFNK